MEESEIFSIKSEDNLDDFIGIDIPNEVIKVIGVGGAGCNALNAIIISTSARRATSAMSDRFLRSKSSSII